MASLPMTADQRLVWVIDPERRTVRIYCPDGTESLVAEPGRLSGENVLPGFGCELATIL